MKRYKNFAFWTSGAVAAAAAMAIWLFGIGGTASVSADVILENLKAALGRKLTIDIENIDLTNVTVNGEIVLDRKGNWLNEETDTLYSELHVAIKADNPDWKDLDGAIVVCQSPETAWTYCRGNGGSGPMPFGEKDVVETDYLIKGHQWREFLENPLGGFGAMPLGLTFSTGDSQVEFKFPVPERTYVQQLLYFLLLNLGNAKSADHVIDQLKESAGNLVVEQSDASTWVLHLTDIKQIGALRVPEPVELPDVDVLTKEHVTTLTYNWESGRISKTRGSRLPDPLPKFGVTVSRTYPSGPWDSVDAMVDELEKSYEVVSSKSISESEWEIEVKGLPLSLDTSGIEWSNKVLPTLMEDLELLVYYDAETKTVQRAEFLGIGLDNGRITLELGEADLDPTRLEWDGWTKGCTVPEEKMNSAGAFALFGDCTVVYDRTDDNN